jgi:predicted nucleotidyltransferase
MDKRQLSMQRDRYRRSLAGALQQITEALVRKPEVKQAFLFGSYAQGRCDLRTDLDILVVMDSPLDFVTRTAEMYRYLNSPVDLDVLVYTPAEWERRREQGFIRHALKTAQVIYEKQAA